MIRLTRRVLAADGKGPFNPYSILGLHQGASKEDIKRAYRRLALKYHPDGGAEGCKRRFQAINEAYNALKDGEWKPQEGESREQTPRAETYVYEEPGSTTENYVHGRTQTLLRLCVVWSAAFVMVRSFLLWVFPISRTPPTVEWVSQAPNVNSGPVSVSVHADDNVSAQAHTQPFMVQQPFYVNTRS
ncbi:DnaJ domain [Trypanosoma vivax]|uniref:Chaperone protein DNAj, putative n=1 Tax=Trypanosoma vivax (strain Y486) TaxID=1055687 RepID=F9WVF4_TRYVY|nr:putative chaperone protein DNAj [Trypanosoma vivax]KAH8607102.1 DnaJ domain [Trypanosoma vivax]CCD21562.1 chaperone protein DNAj, putative [Trypanosoma vivax Y486]|eukprot:CCD21562.1 chaperone protein DNAj, putative [Trypanosoma vivax Y486]